MITTLSPRYVRPLLQDMIVVKVDVDELGDLAHKQGIAAMPTFLFFKCRDFDC